MIKNVSFYFSRRGRLFMVDIMQYCSSDRLSVVKVIIYAIFVKYTKRLDSVNAFDSSFFSSYENREKILESIVYHYTKENLDFYR